MKKYFYAYRDRKEVARVWVCALTDGKSWARGVAVCSPDDEPDDTKGRFEAECRALRALKDRGEDQITDGRARGVMQMVNCPWCYHSEKYCDLSFTERRRLFGKKMELPKNNHPIITIGNFLSH
jgi:hypothetical protein